MPIESRKAEAEDAELPVQIYNTSFYSDDRRFGACPGYGKTVGTQAVQFVKDLYADRRKITLVTPADKEENVKFYTEKCGFRIVSAETDGNAALVRFAAERKSGCAEQSNQHLSLFTFCVQGHFCMRNASYCTPCAYTRMHKKYSFGLQTL